MKFFIVIILVVAGFFAYQGYDESNKRQLAKEKELKEYVRVWDGVVTSCKGWMVANTGAQVLDWMLAPDTKVTNTGYSVNLHATTKGGTLAGQCFTDNNFQVIDVKYSSRGTS